MRLDLAAAEKFLQMSDVVVWDANRLENAPFVKLFQDFPTLQTKFRV